MNFDIIDFEDTYNWQQLNSLVLGNTVLLAEEETYSFRYISAPLALLVPHIDNFTFPRLSQIAKRRGIQKNLTVFAILKNQKVAGIAVIHHPKAKRCYLLSFLVHPNYQKQGVGQALLNKLTEACQQGQYESIHATWRTYWQHAPHWEEMLKKQDWQDQKARMYYVVMNNSAALKSTVKYKSAVTKEDYTFHQPNNELLSVLYQTIQSPKWIGKIPKSLGPFQLINKLDRQASIIIKQANEIVGWLMVHQLKEQLWQVTTVFILPEHRKAGISAFTELVDRHHNRGTLHFMVEPTNRKMLLFVKRYILPYDSKLYEQKVMIKLLTKVEEEEQLTVS